MTGKFKPTEEDISVLCKALYHYFHTIGTYDLVLQQDRHTRNLLYEAEEIANKIQAGKSLTRTWNGETE
jgi:hypothetical protein